MTLFFKQVKKWKGFCCIHNIAYLILADDNHGLMLINIFNNDAQRSNNMAGGGLRETSLSIDTNFNANYRASNKYGLPYLAYCVLSAGQSNILY